MRPIQEQVMLQLLHALLNLLGVCRDTSQVAGIS